MSQPLASTACTDTSCSTGQRSISHRNGVTRVPIVGTLNGGKLVSKEHCQVIVIQADGSWEVQRERA